MTRLAFALNHMTAPALPLEDLLALAARLGIDCVEIRNDLAGRPIADGTDAATVRAAVVKAGMSIASINALYPFNDWTPEREAKARELIAYAKACGAEGIVLVPLNEGRNREDGLRQSKLREAIAGLAPLLAEAGIVGLVEPLGFEVSSLRSKREAAEAIADVGGGATFRLVHDTFHHHLAGEPDLYPELTGLVHISGVDDPALSIGEMLDEHRILVGEGDRLDNVGQIRAMAGAGYRGRYSFEPFARKVHEDPSLEASLRASIAFIETSV